jgi:hypothetical protein
LIGSAVNPLPRSNLLGAKASIESYKSGAIGVLPGGEDCRVREDGVGCLVDAVLEKKVELYGGDVDKVHAKVDLVMQSISLV